MGLWANDCAMEPVMVDEPHAHWAYCNNGESFADDMNLYFSAYLDMPGHGGDTQRKVICRLIIPLDVARKLSEQARKTWEKGGH